MNLLIGASLLALAKSIYYLYDANIWEMLHGVEKIWQFT